MPSPLHNEAASRTAATSATGNTPKPNLVIGVAWGLREEDLLFFAKSFRRVSASADMVLLTKNPSTGAQKLAERERVELVPLQSCYYGLGSSKAVRVRNHAGIKVTRLLARMAYPFLRIGYTHAQCIELWREMNKLIIQTSGGRYLQYLDFLRNRRLQYGKVMVTDVRDVYFQADPFDTVGEDSLLLFEEHVVLGTDRRNKQWVKATFGREVLKSMETRTALCSGVTIGGVEKIIGYLEVMEPELVRRNPACIADQGIHNALAYLGRFDHLGATIMKCETGPVLSMGLMRDDAIKVNADDLVVDAGGIPYPVLHQYDRYPAILRIIQRRELGSSQP